MLHDLKVALRSIVRTPAFGITSVLTLALAAGANAAIFALVYGVLLKPLPFPEADRLVAVWPGRFQSNADLLFTREHGSTFAHITAVAPGWSMSLTGAGEPTKLTVARVSGNFFETFGTPPALGRPFDEDATRPGHDNAIVLAHEFWMKRFGGDPGVIGRTVHLDGDPVQIVAVMPRAFDVFGLRSDAYTPLVMDESAWYHRLSFSLYAARLAPGYSIDQATADYRAVLQRLKAERQYPDDFGRTAAVVDLRTALVGDVRSALVLLAAAAGTILLLAGVNLGTLQLTRELARTRDAAIRTALGASRARIIRGRAIENLLLALGGGIAGVLLAYGALPLMVSLVPGDTPRLQEVTIDWIVLAGVLAAALVVALVAGTVPAARKAKQWAAPALRGGASTEPRAARQVRGLLVSSEVAIAVVLTIGAGLMLQTVWRLQQVDTGFKPDGVLTLHVQPTGERYRGTSIAEYYDRLLERVRALPGVTAAGAIQHLPFSGYSWVTPLDVEGRAVAAGDAPPSVHMRVITHGYFAAIGQPLLAGRPIERSDAVRDDVVVVNEVLASKFFGSPGAALGRKIRSRGSRGPLPWATIVGVVGNVRHTALTDPPAPEIYSSTRKNSIPAMMLAVRTGGDPRALAAPVRDGIWSVDRDVPLSDVQTMDARIGSSLARPRLLLTILGAFAVLGGMIAVVGVYGVVAYSVSQRRRELGIRIALGAQRARIMRTVVREAGVYGAGGLALGVPAAYVASRLVRNLVFGVTTTDPGTYAVIAVVTMIIVVSAAAVPAVRASRVDPVCALKQ